MESEKVDLYDLNQGVPDVEGSIRPRPKFSDKISKRVIVVAFGFVVLIVVLFLVGLNRVGEPREVTVKEAAKLNSDKTDNGTGQKVPVDLAGVEDGDMSRTAGSLQPREIVPEPSTAADTGTIPPSGGQIPKISETTIDPPPAVAQTPEQIAQEQARVARSTRMLEARSGGLKAASYGGEASTIAPSSSDALNLALLESAKNNAPPPEQAQVQAQAEPSGGQDEKLKFLKDLKKEEHGYHPNVPIAAISPNEVKIGSYIPLILEVGTNSDLPGQITARSSEAVYDTVTGCRELIPAMTKFIGRYDSKVDLGQKRMLYAWNSAVFKDGSELNLAGMQGYDSSGQAGLGADVDNHYMRTFGYAFGMSLVTAGIQLSVPTTSANSNAAPSVAQTVSTALSQQYGELGAQLIGKSITIQPTLRNFPGERFMIMVPNTIVMTKVWSNRCKGSGVAFK